MATLLLTSAVVATASTAAARGGGGDADNNGGGFEVEVEVIISGDGAPGDNGQITISVPVQCWWEQLSLDAQHYDFGNRQVDVPAVDGTSAKAMLEWYDEYIASLGSSSINAAYKYSLPEREWFEQRVKEEKTGTDLTFYTPICEDGWDQMIDLGYTDVYDGGSWLGQIPIIVDAWEVNIEPPEPYIDPEDLAIEARDLMEIGEPEIDRNPKITEGPADATFVNLPTWFWVTDPSTVGGEDGERRIRAEIAGSGVWAEVTATTGGLSLASPGGSEQCAPERAMRPWSPGADDSLGCTIAFHRASVSYPEGYPVTASTQWNATWEGVDQEGDAVGGDLDPLQRSTTVNVPVAEVQSIVGRR